MPGSLPGVCAESNTRESIYDALRRRETFATTGTRLKVRFFGGWDLTDALLDRADWVEAAYRRGVPMGGDLAARPAGADAPAFVIWASKDPAGADLDRLQVIKVWEDQGRQHEQVFDVARSASANSLGSPELRVVWKDPDFDPQQLAAYYVRVLELPSPRWTTLLAAEAVVPVPGDVPANIQQRGWSSPIWYSPRRR
jgi:hypothetical protein